MNAAGCIVIPPAAEIRRMIAARRGDLTRLGTLLKLAEAAERAMPELVQPVPRMRIVPEADDLTPFEAKPRNCR